MHFPENDWVRPGSRRHGPSRVPLMALVMRPGKGQWTLLLRGQYRRGRDRSAAEIGRGGRAREDALEGKAAYFRGHRHAILPPTWAAALPRTWEAEMPCKVDQAKVISII